MSGQGGRILRLYAVAYLVFLYAPVLLLPIFAFNDASIIAFPLSGFSTRWFARLAEIEPLHDAALNSIRIALTTAVLATTLGTFAARAGARYAFPLKGGIMGLIMLPLVLPEIIIGASLLVVLLQLGVPLSLWTIILGHTLICIPFAIAILNGAFLSLDRSLEEAAIDLGETPWSTFRLVTLPLIAPGIISAFLISFTISLDEFIIAFFLTGSQSTLPVYIWSMLRFPANIPAVMALGTILLVLSLVLLSMAEFFRRRGVKRTGAADHGGFL
ncbi:MAG: ABC transporter permease [Alphaproteobacteria bacterium]|nr:MAG: ABC transporter permease [Alphaproteobacteria bacterium]